MYGSLKHYILSPSQLMFHKGDWDFDAYVLLCLESQPPIMIGEYKNNNNKWFHSASYLCSFASSIALVKSSNPTVLEMYEGNKLYVFSEYLWRHRIHQEPKSPLTSSKMSSNKQPFIFHLFRLFLHLVICSTPPPTASFYDGFAWGIRLWGNKWPDIKARLDEEEAQWTRAEASFDITTTND